MKVHLYTVCWNEAEHLPFFFRHYDKVVEKYVILDDGSDDGSLEIMAAHPKVELRRFDRTDPQSFILSHQDMHNEVWKESHGAADWVIVTAIDELLTLPNAMPLWPYLLHCKEQGITAIPAIGFQMLGENFPPPDREMVEVITHGAPFRKMNKLSIFNPSQVIPHFRRGRHSAEPRGNVVYPEHDELMLLHYKMVDFEKTLKRQNELGARLGSTDRKEGWGFQYDYGREELRASWDEYAAGAVNVAARGFEPAEHLQTTPWWRAPVDMPPRPEKTPFMTRLVSWFTR